MTLEEIISDAIEMEGLEEIIEEALRYAVDTAIRRCSIKSLLADEAARIAGDHRDEIEEAVLDQLTEVVRNAIEERL